MFVHESKNNKTQNLPKNFCSIILLNHRTRLDWLFYFSVLYREKALNRIKIILKNDIKRIPGLSWGMQSALFIFIKRRWILDQIILSKFIDYFKTIGKSFHVSNLLV
jgi:lysocardiolipin and lysophospholipid acyltransferase